jgi:hypothetical protein
MKKETIEEVAANLADPNLCKTDNWIAGANWQAERMYSEEDMRKAFYEGWILRGSGASFRDALEKWFEQFKKK